MALRLSRVDALAYWERRYLHSDDDEERSFSLWQRGLVFLRAGKKFNIDAVDTFRLLQQKYPNSHYSRMAEMQVLRLRRRLVGEMNI